MTARTDIHSPVNMDPAQYEYVFAIDTQSPWALGLSNEFLLEINEGISRSPLARRGMHQCHHCGAHIRYAALLRHLPTKAIIVVGETCLDNRFSLESKAQFDALRKAAELDRQKQRIVTACNEWIATKNTQGIDISKGAQAPEHATDWERSAYADIVRKFWTYGDMSPRQYDLLVKIATKPAPTPRVEVTPTVPAPSGRQAVVGDVVYTRGQETDFGYVVKCLVVFDGGAKAWGTLPRGAERGDRISFKATFSPKADDKFFAFYSRPAAATVLGEAQTPQQDSMEDSLS